MLMKKTCIIIPCYNEKGRLFVEEFQKALDGKTSLHFCFVDDGSSDSTIEILTCLSQGREERVKVIQNKKNYGKAEAVRTGILETLKWKPFDYVGYFDADLSTPLSEIDTLVGFLEQRGAEGVFGSRVCRLGSIVERNAFRHYMGRFFATAASLALKLPVYDTQCGAKVFKASLAGKIFQEPFLSKWLFDIELLFRMIKIFGHKAVKENIVEVPLNQWVDKKGSKIKLASWFLAPFQLLKIVRYYNKR